MQLADALTHIEIALKDLLLDPNNPRFSELREDVAVIPEARFAEEKIQNKTFEKMKDASFGVSELKDTIKTVGFLPMDRIIVKKWQGTDSSKYVVVEGNRRVTALRWLIQLHDEGKESFSDEQLSNFQKLPCLLLDVSKAPPLSSLILPGLRHVSGIKQWGAYQQAKTVFTLRQSGMSPQDAAQSLGLGMSDANRAYNCFIALERMANDDEYGEKTIHSMYSYFEEILKKPLIREWLGWDKQTGDFKNDTNLREFYSWIIPEEGSEAKLPEAKSIRDLTKIINDPAAMQTFRSDSGSLRQALARYDAEHPEQWEPKIAAATQALKLLTPDMLKKMQGTSEQLILELKERIDTTLADKKALLSSSAS